MKPPFYQEKNIIITGASEGIGLALAEALVKQGAHVTITARDQEKLKEAQEHLKTLRTFPKQRTITLSFDVTDTSETYRVLEAHMFHQGVPDILINCAGHARSAFIEDLSFADIQSMMHVNYWGTVSVCKAVIPHMQERQSGHIVNTSSVAGFLGLFGYTGYCASKFAVMGFSEALRRELKSHGISVSVLCPPATKTPGLDKENQNKPDEVWKTEKKIRVLSPQRVASYVLKNLPKKRSHLIPSWDGRLTHFLNRHTPWVVEAFVKRAKVSGSGLGSSQK